MKKSELKQIIREEIRRVLKEYSEGSPVLPIGKVNLLTGKCKYFNVYETYDGTVEVWKDLRPADGEGKYKLVFTAGSQPLAKKGEKDVFKHDQTRREIGVWTMVDFARVKDMKSLASKYGKSIAGYTYK